VNWTSRRPDAAAIDTTNGARTEPYNAPWQDEDPIRRMYYKHNRYVNGPSGKIKEVRAGHKLYVWGAHGGASKAKVKRINQCTVVAYTHYVKICGATLLSASDVVPGDSGSLVAYRGTSSRHVAGLLFAGERTTSERWMIPAMDLKDAFSVVGKPFSHYWGTKSGYRKPSTQ